MAATNARRKPKRKAPPKRARRSLLASRPALALPVLEPHHFDIIGLALIAVGMFLGGVAYLGWAGGALGSGAVTAVRFVFGALGYAVPAALVAGGALVLMRELRPPARPMRTGVMCLTASVTLALAAGTLGIGPGQAATRPSGRRRHSNPGAASSGRVSCGRSRMRSRRSARTSSRCSCSSPD